MTISFRRVSLTARVPFSIVFFVVALFSACTKSTTEPSPSAGVLQVSIDPSVLSLNPAVSWPRGCNGDERLGWGPFTITLRETGGGTVTVDYWTWEGITPDGQVQYTQTMSNSLGTLFSGTGPTVVLPPNGSVTSRALVNCEGLVFIDGGSLRMNFRGLNGVGGATTAEGRVQIGPS